MSCAGTCGLGYVEDARREFAEALAIEASLADDPLAIVGGHATLREEQVRVHADRVALINVRRFVTRGRLIWPAPG